MTTTIGAKTPLLASFASAQEVALAAAVDATVDHSVTTTGALTVAGALTVTGASTVVALTASGASALAALTATGAVVLSNATITIANLGTVDPHVAGRLWANSGVLTVSAG